LPFGVLPERTDAQLSDPKDRPPQKRPHEYNQSQLVPAILNSHPPIQQTQHP
jgi:hypothetical protein